jgi:hypothetical protein
MAESHSIGMAQSSELTMEPLGVWGRSKALPPWIRQGRKRFRKPFVVLAVILAVIAAKPAEKWRGWMGIEPTQDASAAPRKRF